MTTTAVIITALLIAAYAVMAARLVLGRYRAGAWDEHVARALSIVMPQARIRRDFAGWETELAYPAAPDTVCSACAGSHRTPCMGTAERGGPCLCSHSSVAPRLGGRGWT